MDIFCLPAAIPEPVISLISARLIYKKILERQKMVNNNLYALPIEAHGGVDYANMCLETGVSMLQQGYSINIFPEGAYIVENGYVYRGRTGASRMLFSCYKKGISVLLLPVAIKVNCSEASLDSYEINTQDKISINILKPMNFQEEYNKFNESKTQWQQNIYLHAVMDKSMQQIANSLNKTYSMEYIQLTPKNNVIFKNGQTITTTEAQETRYLNRYQKELNENVNELSRELKRRPKFENERNIV